MRYSTSFLDDVRDRVSLSAVVGRAVQWDKRKTNIGRRDYWACCPFHAEKSPSFHVDEKRSSYHCFGCGVTGDCFRFLMEHEGKTFPEAVEELAGLAGLSLPDVTPESRAAAARRLTLIETNEAAATWFQSQLTASRETIDYVLGRGITHDEIAKFRLGFAPDRNGLLNANLGDTRDMVDGGVLGQSDDGRLYDRFRNRLMFPIFNTHGKTVGFSGRTLGNDDRKYVNSPETDIFDKGSTLYNFGAAREACWNGAELTVVEGSIDVIAACRTGTAAVAPLGTALTDRHVQLLKKVADSVTLCFDGDGAGQKATAKAIDLVLPLISAQFTAKVAKLADTQDPDAMVKRNPQSFIQAIAVAMPLADALWARETAGIAPAVPEQRAKLEGRLRAAIGQIVDRDTKRAYGADFKDRLAALGQRPKVYRSNSYSQHSTSPGASRLMNGFHRAAGLSLKEAILIGAIAAAPQAALDQAEQLSMDERLSPEALLLVNRLVMAMSDSPDKAIAEVLEATGLSEAVSDALAKAQLAGVSMTIGSEDAAAISVLGRLRRH